MCTAIPRFAVIVTNEKNVCASTSTICVEFSAESNGLVLLMV